ncbi:hypothetical protein [Citricoccus muralis]|uniref:Uncharacterized protein n=1 Tax=Citricoccus muralis TaxID=169134 RepID=A0ABY8H4E2_9MICC|nr:hypothetical protein [Citricoccus muralis]WFP15960.1 hypothetical protein P8192_11230 [Citricoccus muralis]
MARTLSLGFPAQLVNIDDGGDPRWHPFGARLIRKSSGFSQGSSGVKLSSCGR